MNFHENEGSGIGRTDAFISLSERMCAMHSFRMPRHNLLSQSDQRKEWTVIFIKIGSFQPATVIVQNVEQI